MASNSTDLYHALSKRTDQELLVMVEKEGNSYTPEAISAAQMILKERSIKFTAPEITHEEKDTVEGKPFMPMVVGVCMVLLAIYDFGFEVDYDSAMVINIFTNILFRIIVVVWLLALIKKFDLHKILWIVLGVLFGGWALIAVNIGLWITPVSLYQPTISDMLNQPILEDDDKDPNAKHGFVECPACHFKLSGNEKKCPDCDLSL